MRGGGGDGSEVDGLLQTAGNFGEFRINFFFAARNRDAHAGEAQGRKEVIVLARVNRDGECTDSLKEFSILIGESFFSYFFELILQSIR